MTEMTPRQVRRLDELPQDIAPTRDLWPGIAASIASASADAAGRAGEVAPSVVKRPRMPRLALGLAASAALLALGMWIGRNMLPDAGNPPSTLAQTAPATAPSSGPGSGSAPASSPVTMAASFELDPASRTERQRRLDALAGQLAALPPETQAKVKASVAAIEKSVLDIQAALGRDPGNLLLQEMLVNSYQEEMRVLGAVDEANRAALGPGI